MSRLADLFRQGAVMGKKIQPYESHLQFIPQWMCDYNLYGCAYLRCSKIMFRAPIPAHSHNYNDTSVTHRWHEGSITPELIIDKPRESYCELEVDIQVQYILNPQEIRQRSLHHGFNERCHYASALDIKLVPSMAALWQDESKRRCKKLSPDQSHSLFSLADLSSTSSYSRDYKNGHWIHEDEFYSSLMKTIEETVAENEVSCDNIVPKIPFEECVRTSLESVTDLFPENLHNKPSVEFRQPVTETNALDTDIDNEETDSISSLWEEIENFEEMNDPLSQAFREEQSGNLEDEKAGCLRKFLTPQEGSSKKVYSMEGNSRLDERQALAEAGIHHSNQLIDGKLDLFEVDEEFVSDILTLETTAGPGITSSNQEIPFQKNSNFCQETSLFSAQESPKYQVGPLKKRTAQELSQKPDISRRLLPRFKNNKKLPFDRVVKDPFDPATILRHSEKREQQLIKSSTKDSQQHSCSSQHLQYFKMSMYRNQASLQNFYPSLAILKSKRIFHYLPECPSTSKVLATNGSDFRPRMLHQNPFYSVESDIPEHSHEYADKEFRPKGNIISHLPPYDPCGLSSAFVETRRPVIVDRKTQELKTKLLRQTCSIRNWEFAPTLPSKDAVFRWCIDRDRKQRGFSTMKPVSMKAEDSHLDQIDGPTQHNLHGFKYSRKQRSKAAINNFQNMSVMSLEVHVNTRNSLFPNPEHDEISCIFWCVQFQDGHLDNDEDIWMGVIILGEKCGLTMKSLADLANEIIEEPTEIDLLTRLVDIVRCYDPDILTGYEVHNSSWGYVIERAKIKFDYDLCDDLSRVKYHASGRFGKENDRWGYKKTSTIKIIGRHVINIWRAMRAELNLLQYTMENVVFHLLQQRIPHYRFQDLTSWYKSNKPRNVKRVISYFVTRTKLNLGILDANELISRTVEQARLLGVDFFSVISRGSQFKVESLMFRVAKPENFILISPSKKQVGQQNALECLPLVMEPKSNYYANPVLVLDFQSLYPSIMIAYNYCYSTCLGRITNWRGRNKMGVINYETRPQLLKFLEKDINISPNGMIYVKQGMRQSLLARMLSEILDTRVMVKEGMKENKDDKHLQRLLNNRQLALKFISNVTYGYTSATFSGRMPCAEIADSIVQSGRETLEKAISLIHSVDKWAAEVVYGDTDSLFIELKGRSREEAFGIGEEIANSVTESNPHPIKLKFEKVYHPCVLLAKKRYVGYKYESRNQKVPEFDAKGIETVRRDGTPVEQKIEEKALKILFETADLSQVKRYFQRQCTKIMQGKMSIQDFMYAREVKLGTYNDNGLPPPGALISANRILDDPRSEPQYGERIPYVVVTGAPSSRLIDRCVTPDIVLRNSQVQLDVEYYITKNIIPPLERIFNLVGVSVRQWYNEMPKYIRNIDVVSPLLRNDGSTFKKTLESYMKSSSCVLCKSKLDSQHPICNQCLERRPISLLHLKYKLLQMETRDLNLKKICRSCTAIPWGDDVACDSKDCPVFYSRTRAESDLISTRARIEPIVQTLENEDETLLNW